jgi:long-chain acyl-CoA synthetase
MSAVSMPTHGSLAHLLAWRARERPDFALLYVEDEGPWCVGHLARAARDLADALKAAGVAPGGRVIVRVGNDERFLAALVATWLRGCAAIAVHPAAPVDEVVRVAEALGAGRVIAAPDDPVVAAGSVPTTTLGRVERTGVPPAIVLMPPEVADGDEALILLTSGSTGAPKGVILTHGGGWANVRATVSAFRRDTDPTPLTTDDRPPNLVANPFSHTGGVVRLLFALYVGRRLVVLRKFDALKAKAAIDTHGIDNLTINPTMLRMLIDALPPCADLGAVRYVSSGTAPLPSTLREEFEARFGVPVLQAYGQTEAFGAIAVESARDVLAGRRRPTSVGRPLPGVDVAILGPSGTRLGPGQDGEICVWTTSATAGYAGEDGPSTPLDGQGWLHTGDLGHLDDDGYVYVSGRLKTIIICGGFNIVPEELEAVLESDPAVREAAVVALPDRRLGEIPVALVEADGDGAAITSRVSERLVAYKRPRRLFVVDALPRLASGKVDKPAARAMAAELSTG